MMQNVVQQQLQTDEQVLTRAGTIVLQAGDTVWPRKQVTFDLASMSLVWMDSATQSWQPVPFFYAYSLRMDFYKKLNESPV